MKTAQIYRRLFTVLPAAALLFGCASLPPTQYFTISRLSPESPLGGKIALSVGVPQFEAEGVYSGDNLLYRRGTHEIGVDYYRRWGVPPQKMLAEATVDYLRAGAIFTDVVRMPTLTDVDLVLAGRILHLEETTGEAGGRVVLVELEFVLKRFVNSEILWRERVSASTPVTVAQSAETVVAATESGVRSCLGQAVSSLLASSSAITSAAK